MSGRRELHRGSIRLGAGVTALGVAGAALAVAMLPASSADAKAPKADYHAGSDKAVFTVTGVEDSNCLVSVGGRNVYIKPGDRLNLATGTAGVALGGLNIGTGTVLGLNVRASIDGGKAFTVAAGKTVKLDNLSAGSHSMSWTATGVGVHIPAVVTTVTGLLGKVTHTKPAHDISVPLSSSTLKSGAKLSWSGRINVTKNAPKCTLSVQTPNARVSVGGHNIDIPGQNVDIPGARVPNKLPSLPSLDPKKKSSSPKSSPSPSYHYDSPGLSVPDMVVPQGDNAAVYGNGGSGAGGYQLGLGTDNGNSTQLTEGGTTGSGSGHSNAASGGSGQQSGTSSAPKTKTVDLASDAPKSSLSGQVPALLAIIAIIVLAIVAGTYARLYLLGRAKK